MKVKKQRIIFAYILLELFLLSLSFVLLSYYKYGKFIEEQYLPLMLAYNIGWILIVFINGSQDLYILSNTGKRFKDVFVNVLILLGIISPLVILLNLDEYSRGMIFGTVLTFVGLNLLTFSIVGRLVNVPKREHNFGPHLLILGAQKNGRQVLDFTRKNKHLGYQVVGFLDDHYPIGSNGIDVIGTVDDLSSILDKEYVDEIVITLPMSDEQKIKSAIQTADEHGVRVNLVPDFLRIFDKGYRAYNINTLPVVETRHIPLDEFTNFLLKKIFDVTFAFFVLVLLSPILLLIALLIKLDSKGPVFYTPNRKGKLGNTFKCYKFRSMYVDNSVNAGTKSTVKDDPRITRVGKYLRKYDLDEMPQFINVLKGDMSVVGPRPHRVNLNDELQKLVDRYMIRSYVKPGISGWAQVNGWRGPTETEIQKRERVRHDLWYIENWSFWLDIKIIFLTVFGRKTRQNAF